MKRAKYYIEFDANDTDMNKRIYISKAEYTNQRKFLSSQVINTRYNDTPVTLHTVITEREGFVETLEHYNCGCAGTYLGKIVCKDGYVFK